MNTALDTTSDRALQPPAPGTVDYKLEVLTIPVSDVDRAKAFYASLGWREDVDFKIRADFRVVHMTPPGSQASVVLGTGVTAAEPGSAEGMILAVYDIEAARKDLIARGVEVSGFFHSPAFDRFGERADGLDLERQSYNSYLSFQDPDGNTWYLQEIQQRLPGR